MRLDRLHILWEFMTMFRIPGREWTFNYTNGGKKNNGFDCGTAGCAMGELPLIWKQFKYDEEDGHLYVVDSDGDILENEGVQEFFGLTFEEYMHIFDYSNDKGLVYEDSGTLYSSASRDEMIDNLKLFINKALDGKLTSQEAE